MRQITRVLQRLFTAFAVLASAAGVMIVLLVVASVVMRHLAQVPFRFTEELVGLLMTSAFFLALPMVTLNAEHVRVRILLAALPAHLARSVAVLAAVLGVVFTLWFCWLCIPWLEFAVQRNIRTEAGRLLMYPWMAVLPLSMLMAAVAFAVSISRDVDKHSFGKPSVDTPGVDKHS